MVAAGYHISSGSENLLQMGKGEPKTLGGIFTVDCYEIC